MTVEWSVELLAVWTVDRSAGSKVGSTAGPMVAGWETAKAAQTASKSVGLMVASMAEHSVG